MNQQRKLKISGQGTGRMWGPRMLVRRTKEEGSSLTLSMPTGHEEKV